MLFLATLEKVLRKNNSGCMNLKLLENVCKHRCNDSSKLSWQEVFLKCQSYILTMKHLLSTYCVLGESQFSVVVRVGFGARKIWVQILPLVY